MKISAVNFAKDSFTFNSKNVCRKNLNGQFNKQIAFSGDIVDFSLAKRHSIDTYTKQLDKLTGQLESDERNYGIVSMKFENFLKDKQLSKALLAASEDIEQEDSLRIFVDMAFELSDSLYQNDPYDSSGFTLSKLFNDLRIKYNDDPVTPSSSIEIDALGDFLLNSPSQEELDDVLKGNREMVEAALSSAMESKNVNDIAPIMGLNLKIGPGFNREACERGALEMIRTVAEVLKNWNIGNQSVLQDEDKK